MTKTDQGFPPKTTAWLAAWFGAGVVLAVGCGSHPLDAISIDADSLKRDLVAQWSFDETSGTTATDSSGNGHDGSVTGAEWITPGRFGGALTLSAGAFVSVPSFPQATASWTVSLWTRTPASALASNATDFSTLASTENQYAGGWELHLDNRTTNQRFDAAYWAGRFMDDYVRVVCACVEADRWFHLAAVWDGEVTKTMTFFVDGQMIGQARMPGRILPGDRTLYFGTWNQGGRFFNGDLDEVAIWRRALEPAEIALLAGSPAAP